MGDTDIYDRNNELFTQLAKVRAFVDRELAISLEPLVSELQDF
jgi:hypothetical protein